jgi:hypothetical protein
MLPYHAMVVNDDMIHMKQCKQVIVLSGTSEIEHTIKYTNEQEPTEWEHKIQKEATNS